MSAEVLELPNDQIEQICVLFADVYGHPIKPWQWNWKYHLGPREGSVNMAARNAEGQWVGHIGASVFPGGDGSKKLAMAQICDIMVGREARGGMGASAVYPLLVRAMQEELKSRFGNVFAYGFPGVRPFRLGERLGFYRSIGRCECYENNNPARYSVRSMPWSVILGEWDSERLDRIWKAHDKRLRPLQVNKPGRYLTWRYRDHPERSYRLWILRWFFQDTGWLITSENTAGSLLVVDALLPSPKVASDALAALARALIPVHEGRPVKVTSWLKHPGATSQETPIVATEFKVDDWLVGDRQPCFQPADTDVY